MRNRWCSITVSASSLAAVLIGAVCSCSDAASAFDKSTLQPTDNPFGPDHPLYAPQPPRDHPYNLAMTADGSKLYVTLQGDEDQPGNQVAVVDTDAEVLVKKIKVGSSPTGIALHPGGRFMAVTNRFSNYVSIIDTDTDRVVQEIQVPYYTIDIAFTPDGKKAYLSNRWKDSVLTWQLSVTESFSIVSDNYSDISPDKPMGIPVGQNPRDLVVSPDGTRVYVAGLTGLTLSIIDTTKDVELRRVFLNSPPGDIKVSDSFVFITHTGSGTHHPPDEGYDTDGDGIAGDGTANVMFSDLQNEVGILSRDGDWVRNYTSDSICCYDYRDVDPDDPTRGERLSGPDYWPARRANFLPPESLWQVACALPEQMALLPDRLLIVCSGSNEVQGFDISAEGRLSPRQLAGNLYSTGMNPYGIVLSPDGTRAYVAERLGEYLTVLDLDAGPGAERRILVGDVSGGEFPATDAEIGEAINFVTAPFTVDGDQTCVHCHREGGNLAKAVAMPLQQDPVWGVRMQMAYRAAMDTRPWFMETAMDETNFFPVINEFARRENFCCEQADQLIWASYPTISECLEDGDLEGCNHVIDCENDPPPECGERRYGGAQLVRNDHFRGGATKLFGFDRTIGDALFQEILDPEGGTTRQGIALDFNGVTRSIGLFLLQEPRLLPNPYAALELPAAERGRRIYESSGTGCATCHPLPVTSLSLSFNPFNLPIRFPALISPRVNRNTGANADGVNTKFRGAFTDTVQDGSGVHFGVPQLRGIWDRAELFYHDGRARSLREALASPGHPGLRPGEVGFNETAGMPDTHGATSHLSAEQLDDLVTFLLTL